LRSSTDAVPNVQNEITDKANNINTLVLMELNMIRRGIPQRPQAPANLEEAKEQAAQLTNSLIALNEVLIGQEELTKEWNRQRIGGKENDWFMQSQTTLEYVRSEIESVETLLQELRNHFRELPMPPSREQIKELLIATVRDENQLFSPS